MMQEVTSRPGYQLKRAQSLLRTAAEQGLRRLGLTMAGYAVLRALADSENLSSADLARRVFVTRQTLGGVVTGLVGQGWVNRRPPRPAVDGRVRPLQLTPAGRRLLVQAERIMSRAEASALAGFAPSDVAELTGLLTAFADNLDR